MYKNQALARDGPDVGLYDKVVKLGGLPKRLDRLIDESQHLQVRHRLIDESQHLQVRHRLIDESQHLQVRHRLIDESQHLQVRQAHR